MCFLIQIRAEKREKTWKYANKIYTKQMREMHELPNQLEPGEFEDTWNE